jgi:hypothetical protein
MNPQNETSVARAHQLARATLCVLAACYAASRAETSDPSAVKTHRLFMGSNLTIVSKDISLPVRDVRNNSFVVKGAKGDMIVAPQSKEFQIKIDDALKLSPASSYATVDKLTFDRIYTPGNDPMRKFEEAARVSAYMADNRDAADAAYRRADRAASLAAPLQGEGSTGIKEFTAAQMSAARMNSELTQTTAMMDAYSTVTSSSRLSTDIAAEAFDALKVTLTLSSPKPILTPYIVIFMRFLEQKDQPETATVWIYAEKLPDIDEHPRKITIMRGGFPPGYHIDSHHVHLYEGTSEIPTSVSRKQMDLTEEEAFQYSVIQHISGSREKTLPAIKSSFFWPQDLHSRLSATQLSRTIFVKVGKDGKATGIFEDKACSRPIPDKGIAQLASELRFLPALEKGKPTESIAALKLGSVD